jgi:cyanophycinase
MMRVQSRRWSGLVVAIAMAVLSGDRLEHGTRVPVPGIGGTLVLLGEGEPPRDASAMLGDDVLVVGGPDFDADDADVQKLAREARSVLERGGDVAVRWPWTLRAGEAAVGGDALGLLPGAVIWDGDDAPVKELVRERRGFVGYSIPKESALAIRGRVGRVVGRSAVTVLLPPPSHDGRRERMRLRPGRERIDLVTLSRASASRTGTLFPQPEANVPEVPTGTLFIGGGGRLPWETVTRFVEASGGPDATIVVIPTALGGPPRPNLGVRDAQMLRRAGARRVVIRHATTPADAETEQFLKPLRDAGGIWFSGGRQWRLVDSYLDTKAHQLMRDVLARGGAVSGSSAGASIQAEYMVRGHPLGNTVMMAEGYERGLGFLPGVAVDQHFTQRDRFRDLSALKQAYPQLLGIGIDEGTVAIVSGHVLEVVGDHRVAMFDRTAEDGPDVTDYVLVRAGQRYDLLARRILNSP